MMMMNKKALCLLAPGLMVLAGASTFAEEAPPTAYDKIWNSVKFVDNDNAKVLKSLAFTGRLQGDAVSFHSEDNNYDDFDWRRFRMGFKARLFDNFILHAEMDGDMNDVENDSWDDFYGRLTDAYVGWNPSKAAKVKIGKQSAGFTLDGATSSKKLLVPERSIVAENLWFTTEYFTGAGLSGKTGDWSYKAGGYSSSGENEFGHFESGYFALLSAGHKIGEKGSLRLDYVYNDPDYDSSYKVGTKKLRHVASLVYKQMVSEKLGIWSGVSGGIGLRGQSDLLGVEIMPFYNFTDSLQLVFQYAGVASLDGNADIKMARYANKNAGNTVEDSQNLLLGFNWYIYGHKLKWQNAIEYNYGKNLAGTGDDYNGYGATSALRISW